MTGMSVLLKRTIVGLGALLALPGLLFIIGFCGIVPIMVLDGDADALPTGIFVLILSSLTLGAGGAAFLHGRRSLAGRPSGVVRLPPAWGMVGAFGVCIALGGTVLMVQGLDALLFPVLFLIAAALPSLWAIAWFYGHGSHADEGLTWRRGMVAFAGGATVSVFLALVLEILLPAAISFFVQGLSDTLVDHFLDFLFVLWDRNLASTLTSLDFLYALAILALVAPLAEEFAKPLVTLPLLKWLSRREAFWVGALAGAGFAALENVIYAGVGYSLWAGVLVVRAVGSAIHPLGSGLVALGWRDLWACPTDARAWREMLKRFGIAVGMHALWNGGSLLVITLGSAHFFGDMPPDVNVLGLSAAGTLLVFLVTLGLGALWLGRTAVTALEQSPVDVVEGGALEPAVPEFSDRAVAIWALACLVAIVPAGVAGLKWLFWK